MTIYTGDGWEVRSGRWQDSPPETVDHVISDPPYTDYVSQRGKPRVGLVFSSAKARAAGRRIEGQEMADYHGCASLSFDGVSPELIAPALTSRSTRWTVLFCAIEQVGAYKEACPKEYVRGGWWAKTNATPQFTGDRPAAPGEAIVFLHATEERKRWNRGGHKAEYRGPSSHVTGAEDIRVHETQKPLWLMRALVEDFTDPGDLVWDPYGGSMTTGVACIQTGRRFLGHEMQDGDCDCLAAKTCSHEVKPYVRWGVERLRAAEQGLTLKAARAGQLPLDLT